MKNYSLYFVFQNKAANIDWRVAKFCLKLCKEKCSIQEKHSAWKYLLWYLIFNKEKSTLPFQVMSELMRKIYLKKYGSHLTADPIFPTLTSLSLMQESTIIDGFDDNNKSIAPVSSLLQSIEILELTDELLKSPVKAAVNPSIIKFLPVKHSASPPGSPRIKLVALKKSNSDPSQLLVKPSVAKESPLNKVRTDSPTRSSTPQNSLSPLASTRLLVKRSASDNALVRHNISPAKAVKALSETLLKEDQDSPKSQLNRPSVIKFGPEKSVEQKSESISIDEDNIINLDEFEVEGGMVKVESFADDADANSKEKLSEPLVDDQVSKAYRHIQPKPEGGIKQPPPLQRYPVMPHVIHVPTQKKTAVKKRSKHTAANIGPTLQQLPQQNTSRKYKTLFINGTQDMIILDDSEDDKTETMSAVSNLQNVLTQASNSSVSSVTNTVTSPRKLVQLMNSPIPNVAGNLMKSSTFMTISEANRMVRQMVNPASTPNKAEVIKVNTKDILPATSVQQHSTELEKYLLASLPQASTIPGSALLLSQSNQLLSQFKVPNSNVVFVNGGRPQSGNVIPTGSAQAAESVTKKMTRSNRWKFSKERVHVNKRDVMVIGPPQHGMRIQPEPLVKKKKKAAVKKENVVIISDSDEEQGTSENVINLVDEEKMTRLGDINTPANAQNKLIEEKRSRKIKFYSSPKRGYGIMNKSYIDGKGKKCYKIKASNFFSLSRKRISSLGVLAKGQLSEAARNLDEQKTLCKSVKILDLIDDGCDKGKFLGLFNLVSKDKLQAACTERSNMRNTRRRMTKAPSRFDLYAMK